MKSGFRIYHAGKRLVHGKLLITSGFMLLIAIIYMVIIMLERFAKSLLDISVYTSSAVEQQAVFGAFDSADISRYAVTLAAALLLFLIYTPLKCGFKLWYMKNAADADNSARVVFSFFGRRFFKCIFVQMLKSIWLILLFALCSIPSAALYLAIYYNVLPLPNALSYTVLTVLSIIMLILYASVAMLYWQVGYVFTMHPDMPIIKLFGLSRRIMKNKRMALIGLLLRCIPLIISCIFVLPAVYAVPVMQSSFAEFAYDASM